MAAYTEERGVDRLVEKKQGRMIEFLLRVRFAKETIFNWALLAAWSLILRKSCEEGREGEQKTHSLRRQNGGAVLVTHCTSRRERERHLPFCVFLFTDTFHSLS